MEAYLDLVRFMREQIRVKGSRTALVDQLTPKGVKGFEREPSRLELMARAMLNANGGGHAFVTRTASEAGTTEDSGWAEQLAAYKVASAAFFASIKPFSPFDALAGPARRGNARTALRMTTLVPSASYVTEGKVKPISSLKVGASDLDERKTLSIIVVNDELQKFADDGGLALLNAELRAAVVRDTNAEFFAGLLDETSLLAGSASGVTAAALGADVATLLGAITFGADAALRLCMHTADAARIAAMTCSLSPTGSAIPSFPTMTPTGGTLFGIPVLVSDEVPHDSSGGSLILVDASQLVIDPGLVTIDSTRNATLVLDTAPNGDANDVAQSLWQEGRIGTKVERIFAFSRLNDSCVAWLDGTAYGTAGVQ